MLEQNHHAIKIVFHSSTLSLYFVVRFYFLFVLMSCLTNGSEVKIAICSEVTSMSSDVARETRVTVLRMRTGVPF